jgi:hypothetical protein
LSAKTFSVEAYGTPSEADHPVRLKVTITPERADQIRRMAEIVKQHKRDGLDIWSIRAWDYTPDWLKYAENAEGNEIDGEPERMDCCAIMVSDDDFFYQANVKNCDIECQSELINIKDLPPPAESEAQEFVEMAAALTKDGECEHGEGCDEGCDGFDMPNDDAVDTLHSLISAARSILERQKEAK